MTNDDKQESGFGSRDSGVGGSQNDSTTDNRQPTTADSEAKCTEYLEGWKRARADYENLLKNQAQLREEDRRRLRIQLAEELLPVIDNFGYVTQHLPDVSGCDADFQKKFATWSAGIGHIDRQFTEALKALGVEAIEALNKPFDPNLHEASGTRREEEKGEGIVLEEKVKGWRLGDVVLRPAKVIVSE